MAKCYNERDNDIQFILPIDVIKPTSMDRMDRMKKDMRVSVRSSKLPSAWKQQQINQRPENEYPHLNANRTEHVANESQRIEGRENPPAPSGNLGEIAPKIGKRHHKVKANQREREINRITRQPSAEGITMA